MPCNWNQRELARHVRRGIIESRPGTPVEFQHDRRLGRCLDGDRGHARVPRVARDDRGLDRARRARATCWTVFVCSSAATRRSRRQSGDRASRPPVSCFTTARSRRRFRDRDVTIQDVFEAVGAGGRDDEQRRRARARGCRLPWSRRLRWTVHREHDGDGRRVPGIQSRRADDILRRIRQSTMLLRSRRIVIARVR